MESKKGTSASKIRTNLELMGLWDKKRQISVKLKDF